LTGVDESPMKGPGVREKVSDVKPHKGGDRTRFEPTAVR
jgi:hypothetical protein